MFVSGERFQPNLVFRDKHSSLSRNLSITAVISFMIQPLAVSTNIRLGCLVTSSRKKSFILVNYERKKFHDIDPGANVIKLFTDVL